MSYKTHRMRRYDPLSQPEEKITAIYDDTRSEAVPMTAWAAKKMKKFLKQ